MKRRRWIGLTNLAWVDHEVGSYISIRGKHCEIILERRQPYCDRGSLIAKLFVHAPTKLHVDEADMWPRYYFDDERAKLEVEAWLDKRGE